MIRTSKSGHVYADRPNDPTPISNRSATVYTASMSETQMQDAIIEAAERNGCLVMHINDSRGQKATGFPDLIVAKPGRDVLFLELKTDSNTLSAPQEEWRRTLLACSGCEYRIVRPTKRKSIDDVTYDELLGWL